MIANSAQNLATSHRICAQLTITAEVRCGTLPSATAHLRDCAPHPQTSHADLAPRVWTAYPAGTVRSGARGCELVHDRRLGAKPGHI